MVSNSANEWMDVGYSMNRKRRNDKEVKDSPRMRTYQCEALDTNRTHRSSCAILFSLERWKEKESKQTSYCFSYSWLWSGTSCCMSFLFFCVLGFNSKHVEGILTHEPYAVVVSWGWQAKVGLKIIGFFVFHRSLHAKSIECLWWRQTSRLELTGRRNPNNTTSDDTINVEDPIKWY